MVFAVMTTDVDLDIMVSTKVSTELTAIMPAVMTGEEILIAATRDRIPEPEVRIASTWMTMASATRSAVSASNQTARFFRVEGSLNHQIFDFNACHINGPPMWELCFFGKVSKTRCRFSCLSHRPLFIT